LIPASVRQPLKKFYLERKLDSVIARVAGLASNEVPSRGLLEELQDAWDNKGMAARTDYLEAVAREATQTDGPILECGSGLTTLLLGAIAGRRGVEIYTLEHLREWHRVLAQVLARHRVPNVRLLLTPLRSFGDFSWYDAPIAAMPSQFSLVVCDGPPSETPGGRYGVLPRLRDRIGARTVLLLDDAERPGEVEVLKRWLDECPMAASIKETPSGTYAMAVVNA
jgi:predicted O-methyltransferase YrrM